MEKTLAMRGLKMHFESVAAILQRLLCMPRAQLHAECYKTQHGCSTTLPAHACMPRTNYIRYMLAHSLTCLLSPLSRARYRCVCVCAYEKCAPSMWNRTQKLGKLLRRSLAKRDRERERGGESALQAEQMKRKKECTTYTNIHTRMHRRAAYRTRTRLCVYV